MTWETVCSKVWYFIDRQGAGNTDKIQLCYGLSIVVQSEMLRAGEIMKRGT